MSSYNKLAACLLSLGSWAAATPISFRIHELPRAVVDAPYHADIRTQVDGRCPLSDVTLEVSGSLPRGLELAGDALTGIARDFGVFPLTFRAVNGCSSVSIAVALEVTARPILRVSPQAIELVYRQGEGAGPSGSMLVSATWADLPYTVVAPNAPWLQVKAVRGATPPEGSPYAADTVQLQVVAAGLAPGQFHTIVTVSTPLGAIAVRIPVTLRVLAR